jgi:hypothetical protein
MLLNRNSIVLAALRAKQEREKGCDYCNGDISIGADGGAHDFCVHEDSIFFYDSQFGWEGETISFCPWCGRNLEPKEAE